MSNIIPFLVLPVVGGYAFSSIWIGSLYHSSRESGHRLYFRSIFYAAFLVICSACFHLIIFDNHYYQAFLLLNRDILNIKGPVRLWSEEAGPAILIISFTCGPIMAHILNLDWMRKLPYLQKVSLYWREIILKYALKNNDFELLLFAAFKNERPVMFSLSSGKVYIGRLVRAPNPVEHRKAIRITPLLSGYRNSENHTFSIVTDYYEIISQMEKSPEKRLPHLKELSQQDFEIVFPSDSVSSAHLFDLDTYASFNDVTESTNEEPDV